MAWYDAQNMGSAFPLLDYGTQTIARNVNNALPNNRNTNRYSGLEYGQQYFPDEEVVDETVTSNYPGANRPLNTLDPNWQHQIRMQEIDRGNIDNRGINFPSIFGTVKGGLEWLGDKFKRPEAKQRAYEEIMKGGTYKGKGGYELYDTPSGLKIGSDILGTGQGYAKNFDSMFGSQSIEEMEQKKLDWARDRLRRGKAISKRLQKEVDLADGAPKDITSPTITTTGGATTPNVHGGGSEASFTRTSPGGISQATSRAARTDQGGNVMSGWRLAEGGRIGYRERGFVDPDEPAENIFDFMQDQGINYDQMAEGVNQQFPSDALGAINLNEEQMTIISDLNDKMETPDISLMSTISGAAEDAVERFIRLLNTQSQAQGGSVGYFEGGLASLV